MIHHSTIIVLTLLLTISLPGATPTQPATQAAFDLNVAADLLTKAAGGKWEKQKGDPHVGPVLYGTFSIKPGLGAPYVVFPFPWDKRGQAKVLAYTDVRARPFRMLGVSNQVTVLVGPVAGHEDASARTSGAITKALKLKKPKVTLKVLWRAERCRKQIILHLIYYDARPLPSGRVHPTLVFTNQRIHIPIGWRVVNIDQKQINGIVDHLLESGFFGRALDLT
ncbi:unnamed protein product, partial [marine sediment metagenome]